MNIPFNKPSFEIDSIKHMNDCFKANRFSGNGLFSNEAEKILDIIHSSGKSLLTQSCTQALELSLQNIELKPGDEVILPSFNFTSAAVAVVANSAVPVFVDSRLDTKNIDENLIENSITKKTKAIIVMHYAGVGCEMDKINKIREKYNLILIEDNAHGLGSTYKNKKLGTFGDFSTLSFHETKNIQCGEGGAIIVNKPDSLDWAEIYREKGTNRTEFFRGIVDKYNWVGKGSSMIQSEILSSLLLGQLENFESISLKRKTIWDTYYSGLKDWGITNNIGLPIIPKDIEHSSHIFYLVAKNSEIRNNILTYLKTKGIAATTHYECLHDSPAGKKFGRTYADLPNSKTISQTIFRLPIWNSMDAAESRYVIQQILDIPKEIII
jgi:dTDP-4-amino-4,6-dideoxygalactose transaminase